MFRKSIKLAMVNVVYKIKSKFEVSTYYFRTTLLSSAMWHCNMRLDDGIIYADLNN